MMILGVNIMEQECIDMTNEVAKNGHIYFPEFCRIVLRKFREDDDEQFAQVMFKVRTSSLQIIFCHQQILIRCSAAPNPSLSFTVPRNTKSAKSSFPRYSFVNFNPD